MEDTKKSIKCWACINKNGFLVLFTQEPKRNVETGKWEGEFYLNSVIYKIIKDLFENTVRTWENDAEYFEFALK
jgi:hypothetical protein